VKCGLSSTSNLVALKIRNYRARLGVVRFQANSAHMREGYEELRSVTKDN